MKEEIDYVNRSQYRLKVMKSLEGEVKIPSEIANDAEIFQNHISNTLRQLKEHNLVECINPEVKKGRLYRLTDKGEEIVNEL
ncbi:MAG: ArsR family transcriptional regulator [Methanobrevibacter sp.]|uniref:ArsR family transcriptional regulator n=1 Tax=Methanobrevibacter sp. TaxID=66852 RepID=UPI0025F098ED|nr:ArsR family transcriptional regulator [Methanobrevibacter sp.]MBE6507924.1 ArsR family transcriptional regulator [Methanobrevibacter sp.]